MVWELRWHPLYQEWIIVAAHRQTRPWVGEVIPPAEADLPEYDPDCYLCPGNVRASGERNPNYESTFAFNNDFPCVSLNPPLELSQPVGIYRNRPALGIARVLCYHPKHNMSLSLMDVDGVKRVIEAWREEFIRLSMDPNVAYVFIFENRGEVVGVSNPHPHCQIYALSFICKLIERELEACQSHFEDVGRRLMEDIVSSELADGRRIIVEGDAMVAFVPYFARYAYEVMIAPKAHRRDIAELSDEEISDLAEVLHCVLIKYDNLWRMPFPYVLVLHSRPTDGGSYDAYDFHIEIYPPLRAPNLRKYLAGPEIGGGVFLSDTSPEEKAAELRSQPNMHYKHMQGTA
ncbi:MAG: galactose-1-phosphate uridylyltransferase [Armatimonadota bacterium]|nr:galactose-1-phosphate uridylyltransferase [Armatimonadota bacterium]MCX7776802.1 galactose-1-phosphate uridylyltransferase [Armatimonadota bacterium]MDW8024598.1 galactose-1-phosphate uridylyltransferase [Armatimonadota bacterium]